MVAHSSTTPFMDNLADKLGRFENTLSYASRIPVVGILPGVAKVALGTLQTLVATGGTVVGAFARVFGNKAIFSYSVDHLKNGLGNVAAGSIEAIPGAGTFLWILRKDRCGKEVLREFTQHAKSSANKPNEKEEPVPLLGMYNPVPMANKQVKKIFATLGGIQDCQEIKFIHYHLHKTHA